MLAAKHWSRSIEGPQHRVPDGLGVLRGYPVEVVLRVLGVGLPKLKTLCFEKSQCVELAKAIKENWVDARAERANLPRCDTLRVP